MTSKRSLLIGTIAWFALIFALALANGPAAVNAGEPPACEGLPTEGLPCPDTTPTPTPTPIPACDLPGLPPCNEGCDLPGLPPCDENPAPTPDQNPGTGLPDIDPICLYSDCNQIGDQPEADPVLPDTAMAGAA